VSDLAFRGRTGPLVGPPRRPKRARRRLAAHDRHAARVQFELTRKPVLWFERFPVTILLALMYGMMAVLPALEHHTQPERLIVKLCCLAVAATFVMEFLFALLPTYRSEGARRFNVSVEGSALVLITGFVAQALTVFTSSDYAAVATGTTGSGLATAVSPVQSWLTVGVVLFLWHWRHGHVTRRVGIGVLAVGLAMQLALLQQSGRSAPLAAFALTVLFVAVVVRAVRLRWVVAVVVIGVFAWPTLYGYRNTVRSEQVQPTGRVILPASQRLREDLNMGQLIWFNHLPVEYGQPSVATELRYGLVPRVLDSGRPALQTPAELSVALGSTATSSSTLTTLGEAYASNLWLGVAFYLVPVALLMQLALRRRSPWGLLVAAALVTNAIWIESDYPDFVAATLQALVSLAGVWVAMRVVAVGRRSAMTLLR
jgi:hypothetical protein